MSNPYKFTVSDNGKEYTFKTFAAEFGVTYNATRYTWLALHMPEVVTLAQMMPKPKRGNSPAGRYTNTLEVVFPDGEIRLMNFREIADHCNLSSGNPVTPLAIYKRWNKMERPDRVKVYDISKTKSEMIADRKAMEIKSPAAEALDGIEAGDLEHLSNGPVNTGAARQGCDEWGNRKTFQGGSSFQGCTSIGMPCYQGKQ